MRIGGGQLLEIDYADRRFNLDMERQGDGPAADPLYLASGFDFGDDEAVRAGREGGGQVVGFEARPNPVDTHQPLRAAEVQRSRGFDDRRPGLGLAIERHAVFKVEADRVCAQRDRLFDLTPVPAGNVKEGTARTGHV